MRAAPLVVALALAACDYQPRPGSEPRPRSKPAASQTVTAGGECQLTLAVDGMT